MLERINVGNNWFILNHYFGIIYLTSKAVGIPVGVL